MSPPAVSASTQVFRAARDLLIRHREDYAAAMADFRWPQMPEFNWALATAWVILRPGFAPNRETAKSILTFTRTRLAPYQKIRIIEFCDLPKTVSGKIRRTDLRKSEAGGEQEFFETDFPELMESTRA